jgi:DNA-binding CsgD family transcriptional regulator
MQLTIDHDRGFDSVRPNEVIRERPSEFARAVHEVALQPCSLRTWFSRIAACVQPVIAEKQGLIAALVESDAGRYAVQHLVFVGTADHSCAFTRAATLTARVVSDEHELFGPDGLGRLLEDSEFQDWPLGTKPSEPHEHCLLRFELGRLIVLLMIPDAQGGPTPEQCARLRTVRALLQSALALRLASSGGSVEQGFSETAFELLRRDPRCERVTGATALALWQGLFNGPWTLLAHASNTESRTLLIRRAQPGLALTRPFTARERAATEFAIQGQSLKWIGSEVGIAMSTASLLISSAIRKLGLRSRIELTEIFGFACAPEVSAYQLEIDGDSYALLDVPLRKLAPPAGLTGAEREVVLGVLSDKSNAEIAQSRRVSVNTIANQLRAVYQKLGVSGRSELLCMC